MLHNGLKQKKNDSPKEWHSSSIKETLSIAKKIGAEASKGALFCFLGDLGAGKTTFIKGFVEGALGISTPVTSPTFTYLNIYTYHQKSVYHFDLYRLKEASFFLQLGFEEYLFSEEICCIEWSERIASLLPLSVTYIQLEPLGEQQRKITLFSKEGTP